MALSLLNQPTVSIAALGHTKLLFGPAVEMVQGSGLPAAQWTVVDTDGALDLTTATSLDLELENTTSGTTTTVAATAAAPVAQADSSTHQAVSVTTASDQEALAAGRYYARIVADFSGTTQVIPPAGAGWLWVNARNQVPSSSTLTVDVTMIQGDTFQIPLQVIGSDGNPFDLSSGTLAAQMREEEATTSPLLVTFSTTVTNATEGRLTVDATAAQTAAVTRSGYWDLRHTDGDVTTLAQGFITLDPSVTP